MQQDPGDIVFNASEEARYSRHIRHTESLIREKFREEAVVSPRQLIVTIPSGDHKRENAARPPQEIVIKEEKPPIEIEVKGSFCPPREIVVVEHTVKDDGQVPNVIQISDMAAAKQAAVMKSLSSTEMAVKGHPPETKQPQRPNDERLVEALDQFHSHSRVAVPRRNTVSATQQPQQHHQRGMSFPVENTDPERLRRELPSLGDEITVIKHSESEITPQIRRLSSGRKQSPDPPAAKASTTNRQILPDFSNLAGSSHSNNMRRRGHRKNILDDSNGQANLLHQSWPAASARHLHGTTPNKSQRTQRRVPQWLGVTGTPEDWIRPDDIQQIGRKIASQRLEI